MKRTVHCQPLIEIFTRREAHSLSQIATSKSGINVLAKSSTLQAPRKNSCQVDDLTFLTITEHKIRTHRLLALISSQALQTFGIWLKKSNMSYLTPGGRTFLWTKSALIPVTHYKQTDNHYNIHIDPQKCKIVHTLKTITTCNDLPVRFLPRCTNVDHCNVGTIVSMTNRPNGVRRKVAIILVRRKSRGTSASMSDTEIGMKTWVPKGVSQNLKHLRLFWQQNIHNVITKCGTKYTIIGGRITMYKVTL